MISSYVAINVGPDQYIVDLGLTISIPKLSFGIQRMSTTTPNRQLMEQILSSQIQPVSRVYQVPVAHNTHNFMPIAFSISATAGLAAEANIKG